MEGTTQRAIHDCEIRQHPVSRRRHHDVTVMRGDQRIEVFVLQGLKVAVHAVDSQDRDRMSPSFRLLPERDEAQAFRRAEPDRLRQLQTRRT